MKRKWYFCTKYLDHGRTGVEHVELMRLIEVYEEYSLQRLRQLGQLATLRKMTLDELIE